MVVNSAIGLRMGGLLRGVLFATVGTMRSVFGTDADDLLVGVGLRIGFDSYEVGTAGGPTSLMSCTREGGLTRPGRPGHAHLDLGGVVLRQIVDLGVRDGNVHRVDVDIMTESSTYFSDRAARPCGRFLAVVALTR